MLMPGPPPVRRVSLVIILLTAVGVTAAGEPVRGVLQPTRYPTRPLDATVLMLHATDLFRPHDDPDDHWDLASVYALANQKRVELTSLLIDYPKPQRGMNPDVMAVAQLNYLTGKAVPVLIGAPQRIATADAAKPEHAAKLRAARGLLDVLRRAPHPVVINILGSCRDVAAAGQLEPELFAQKCEAIYLNAGSGTRDPELAKRLEWNVKLDAAAYAAIFDLPCPVYWLPCFEVADDFQVSEYGSFYRFRQRDVLPQLSDHVQKYFAYVFKHGRFEAKQQPADAFRPDWLEYLDAPKDVALLERIGAMDRNMWCTAGFLHAAGLTVASDGRIAPLTSTRDAVFTFDTVDVTCSIAGVTQWQPALAIKTNRPRYIFHVRDTHRYQAAMTTALLSLLKTLP